MKTLTTHKLYVVLRPSRTLHTVQVGYTPEFFPALYKTTGGAERTAKRLSGGVLTLYIQTPYPEFPRPDMVAHEVRKEAKRHGIRH